MTQIEQNRQAVLAFYIGDTLPGAASTTLFNASFWPDKRGDCENPSAEAQLTGFVDCYGWLHVEILAECGQGIDLSPGTYWIDVEDEPKTVLLATKVPLQIMTSKA